MATRSSCKVVCGVDALFYMSSPFFFAVRSGTSDTGTLIDLVELDVPSAKTVPIPVPIFPIIPPPPNVTGDSGSRLLGLSSVNKQPPSATSAIDLLDVELLSLGKCSASEACRPEWQCK